jgi:hypothetical protein
MMFLAASCGNEKLDADSFEYYGKLSVVRASNGVMFFFLETDEGVEYQMEFNDATKFVNIEEAGEDRIWALGRYYGVDGELEGLGVRKTIVSSRIVLMEENDKPE